MFYRIFSPTDNNRGMALVATIIFAAVISTFAIALLSMTSSDIKLSSLQEASKEAFYIAEAGLDRAIGFLEDQGNPDFYSPGNPFQDENGGSPKLGNGTYTVGVEQINSLDYKITSTGKMPHGSRDVTTNIEAVVSLDNFAVYAYFSNQELFPASIDPSQAGTKIWFFGDDRIEGRLHSNERLYIAGRPTFDGLVTSAYRNPHTGDVSWEKYDNQTNPNFIVGYQGGVAQIPLPKYRNISDPDDPKSLQRIAAGSKDLDAEPNGVYLADDGSDNLTNGIWVKGNVENLVLGTDTSGNSKITIEQKISATYNKKTEIYTIEAGNSLTLMVDGNSETFGPGTVVINATNPYNLTLDKYYSGQSNHTNGLLYVKGEIKGLSGTASDGGIKGNITIASDKTITIANDLKYNTRVHNPDCFDVGDDEFPDIPDTLGIISEGHIKIKSNAPYNLEINAMMMALGDSFYYEGWNGGSKKGTLTVYGSFTQNKRGPVGSFNSFGQQSGYTKDYHFDKRMSQDNPHLASALPPFFPTTGKYSVKYWREL